MAGAKILTPTQDRFLRAFFAQVPAAETVYLSGGTALAGFFLHHRRSDDLDFFTRSETELPALERRAEQAAAAAGLAMVDRRREDHAVRLALAGDPGSEHRLEKIDIMWDSPPYFASPSIRDGISVDDLRAIAVNKVLAIDGRQEVKDFVDLYFIARETSERIEALIPLAKQKLIGLEELQLAGAFLRVRELAGLVEFQNRYMVKPLDWDELVALYSAEAERIFALFPPASSSDEPRASQ